MKYKDYYETLGLQPGAKAEEIKKAFLRLARKYHPDVCKEAAAADTFKQINEAYQTLSDPEKREAYDQLGRHAPGEEFRPPPEWGNRYRQGGAADGGWDGGAEEYIDLSDLFERMGFRSGRPGSAGAAPSGGAPFSMRGQDVEVAASISLADVVSGTEVSLELVLTEMGSDGRVRQVPRTVRIRVPKGVIEGERLRVPGKGGAGVGGGPPGDLYLDIRLQPHPLFKVVGHDLYLDVPIAPWEAVLGCQLELPTLDGRLQVVVKPGARGGQKLRLKGKGLPRRKNGAGDLYGVLQLVTPTVISEAEKALYQQLGETSNFHPRTQLEAGHKP